MEITGTLIHILPAQTGQGKNGPWKKQDFVIETTDAYPKKACFSAWGDKIDFSKLKTGAQVKVSFDVESREYNSKWYTDLKAFGLQVVDANKPVQQGQEFNGSFEDTQDDLPF